MSLAAVYSYGAFARRARGMSENALPPVAPEDPAATAVDRRIGPATAGHPGQTGLALIDGNLEAFAVRARSARSAGRSLDLQYYIWDDDLTGRLLLQEILAAADRGVRVRLLLDDVNAQGKDRVMRTLDAHANIEVRLFNPSRNRDDRLRRGIELLLRAVRTTRRMHNKAWIADGRLAIVGGRNIADKYFDADAAANFRDLDVIAIGPVAEQAAANFDRYWNCEAVIPIRRLRRATLHLGSVRQGLVALRSDKRAKPYLDQVETDGTVNALLSGRTPLHWTAVARLASDPPEKCTGGDEPNWLRAVLTPYLVAASSVVEIISPYFIPRVGGTAILLDLATRGVQVSVLTNSLAATDVAAVHGAYVRYRKRLVAGGVQLFELRAYKRRGRISLFGSSSASLHTKAFTVDGHLGFIGSMNFDPRSILLNTEMGVLFQHEALVAEVRAVFAEETQPPKAYRLGLESGHLVWHDGARIRHREPLASWTRQLIAAVAGILPIESQL